jgi:hypothetical protein
MQYGVAGVPLQSLCLLQLLVLLLTLPGACLSGVGEASAGGEIAAASAHVPDSQTRPVSKHCSCFRDVHSWLFAPVAAAVLLLLPSGFELASRLAAGSSALRPWQLLASSRHSSCRAEVRRELLLRLLCPSCIKLLEPALQT